MAYRPAPRQSAEGLDKAAKIKLIGSGVALLVAALVLISYFFNISIFGGGRPADPPLTPAQETEMKQKQQEIKKQIQEQTPTGPGGRPPVIVGS